MTGTPIGCKGHPTDRIRVIRNIDGRGRNRTTGLQTSELANGRFTHVAAAYHVDEAAMRAADGDLRNGLRLGSQNGGQHHGDRQDHVSEPCRPKMRRAS